MSSTVIVPPPNSSSVTRNVPRLTERARALLTELNLHFAGVAALGVLVLYLLVHLVIVWQGLNANDDNALATQHSRLVVAEIAAKPLRGLDAKLADSTRQADAFYANVLGFDITCRLPGASFFASGGYHHHLATNTWRTAGLPGRTEPVTGLAGIELVAQSPSVLDAVRSRVPASAATLDQPSVLTVLDPWGLPVSVVTGQHDRR